MLKLALEVAVATKSIASAVRHTSVDMETVIQLLYNLELAVLLERGYTEGLKQE